MRLCIYALVIVGAFFQDPVSAVRGTEVERFNADKADGWMDG